MFAVDGVNGVFFGSDFITITKDEDLDWQVLKPMVLGAITDHYNSGEETVIDNLNLKKSEELNENQEDSDIVKQIKELIDTRVRPAVAMDGGDIVYQKFEKGIVYLQMQGACSGCPSSAATLKTGIENMLKHYVPEVIEVRPVNE
jgi:Fe-S cluster biogenesis protein NfuA